MDAEIEGLYRLPLGEFTGARNALAKTLAGTDKARVARLTKPSMPMWAINQLYWRDRPTYKALIDASEKLRAAHKAVLTGRPGDVRKAEELHRTTVEKAVARTIALAQREDVKLTDPVRDAVRRTLAALPTDEPPGRLTREPPPAGFSLLTGIKPAPPAEQTGRLPAPAPVKVDRKDQLVLERLKREAEKRARREEAAAKREAERRKRAEEKRAKEIARAEQALREAERRLARLKTP